ncbi:MAG: hypothetical protein JSR98_18080, partial [Proteobacteria bacterium]|nr:hypothetical protein [Pseudomonadota bacterium]
MAYVDRPDPPRRFGFTSYADDTPRFEAFDDPAFDETRFTYEDAESDWEDERLDASGVTTAAPRLIAFFAAFL